MTKQNTTKAEERQRFRPYPKYKDSDVEWLGEIPARWDVSPLFTIARERNAPNKGGQETHVLSLSYGRIIPRDISDNFGLMPESFETYQVVEPGSVVLRLTDLQNDKRSLRVGLVESRGIVTSAYVALDVTARITARFGFYLLHAYDVTKVFYTLGVGVRQTMKFEDLKRMPILVPEELEQRAIAAFLDRETARIDGLVAKKERLIDLLQEKRASLITRAVTRGLDTKVPMKDSGVEWLGQVPAHWEVIRLRYVIRRIEQGWSPDCDNREASDGEWGVLKAGCVNRGVFDQSENKALPTGVAAVLALEVSPGDLLMSRASGSRDLVGSVALVRQCRPRLLVCDKLFRLHLVAGVADPQFLALAMNSRFFRWQVEVELSGGSGLANNLPQEAVKGLTLGLPTNGEQRAVVDVVEKETARIDELIAKVRGAIDRLKELRTALISAAVTGKIDVREEAA